MNATNTTTYQAGPRMFETLDEAIEYAERNDFPEVATVFNGNIVSIAPISDECSRANDPVAPIAETTIEAVEVIEAVEEQEYIYATVNRVAMYGTAPEGFTVKSEEQSEAIPYGTIAYNHKLTQAEMYKWEIIPISDNAYTYAIGQHVLVNECDESIITKHLPNGRYEVKFDCTGTTDNVHYKQIEAL